MEAKKLSWKIALDKFWGNEEAGLCAGFKYLAGDSKIFKIIVDVAGFIIEALDKDEEVAV